MTETVDVRAMFAQLASDVGAERAHPLADGSLLLEWQSPVPMRVLWKPFERDAGLSRPGMPGRLLAKGPASVFEHAVRRLSQALRERAICGIDPFVLTDRTGEGLSLGPAGLERALGSFLGRGLTRWGELVFTGVRAKATTLLVDFEGAGYRASFWLRPLRDDIPSPFFRVGPIAVGLQDDTRPSSGFDGAVEGYLSYALLRVIGTAASLTLVDDTPASPPAQSAQAQRRRESLFGEIGSHSGASDVLASCIGAADDGTSVVLHGHTECNRNCRFLTATGLVTNSRRLESLPVTLTGRRARLVDVSEMEAITGDDQRFRQAVRRSVEGSKTRLLVIGETCVAECIGLPLGSIAAEEVGPDVPIAVLRMAIDDCTTAAGLWSFLFRAARRDLAVESGRVNLVGFGPARSAFVDEFRALLRAAGLRLGGVFVPSFRTDAAEAFLSAECTVVNDNSLTSSEFKEVRASLPTTYLDVRAPFGPRGTRDLLDRVCATCGRAPPSAAAESAWEPYRVAWEAFQSRAAAQEIAIVVGDGDDDTVLDPRRLHGIDLIACLTEMGFALRFVVRGSGGQRVRIERRVDELGPGVRVAVETARSESLRSLLARLPSRLVFSSYPSDSRVWDAGKVPVDGSHFEMGFGGALRTLARLVRLSECGFRPRSSAQFA